MAEQFYLEGSEKPKRPEVIICISSDEESDSSDGLSSFWGSLHSSDELMDVDEMVCKTETLLEELTTPRPSIGRGMTMERQSYSTQSPQPGSSSYAGSLTPQTSSIYFDEKMCYAPSKRDPRLRRKHPIELCSMLTPVNDTPSSPLPQDRPQETPMATEQAPNWEQGPTVENVVTHFQNLGVNTPNPFSDCLICGRSVEQIRNDATEDYIIRTTTPSESEENKQRRREAYVAGMAMGTFLFVPTGLSQAAACDGINYTIRMGNCAGGNIPGTIPLN